MLNFDFLDKGLGIASPAHFVYDFSTKMFLRRAFSYQKLSQTLECTFNGQNCKKQKRLGTSDQSLFRLQNKFTKISLIVIYYQTKFDGVI